MRRPTSGTLVLGAVLVAALLSTRWLRLNVSGSVPYGVYRLRPVPATLARGILVVFPVPVSVRPWWSAWVPLLKPIGGGPCLSSGERTVCQRRVLRPGAAGSPRHALAPAPGLSCGAGR